MASRDLDPGTNTPRGTNEGKKEWKVQSFVEQRDGVWPKEGRHILAQYDDDTIVVYQAFSPAIADYAVTHQK